MNEIIFLIEDAPQGGLSARALGHSAVSCHFDDGEAPKLIRLHYVREEVIQA